MTRFPFFFLFAAVVEAFAPHPPFLQSHSTFKTSLFTSSRNENENEPIHTRRSVVSTLAALTASPLLIYTNPANARLEGVNKPELLPSEPGLNVIQVEKFLTKGQEKRLNDLLAKLEQDTGYRVRVLCQAYPRTPG